MASTFPAPEEPGLRSMEARLIGALPQGPGWAYEPKWDGFRCLAWKDGRRVALRSRSGKPLGRYFPEVEALLAATPVERFLLDGELLIAIGDALSFAALQARLHPAESRIRRLARETPAQFMLFDCLHDGTHDLAGAPQHARRAALEALHRTIAGPGLRLSPVTQDAAEAERWLARAGAALDGIVAKRQDLPYRPGERAMAKVKRLRTADCVVGGFRYARDRAAGVGSLLLGLYDDVGRLDHVGFTSGLDAATRRALAATLAPLIGGEGFSGDAPGGPSRWSTERSADWQPLRPERVMEVCYDQITGGRFRHGTRLLRWRPDKHPRDCGREQLVPELRPAELEELLGFAPGA